MYTRYNLLGGETTAQTCGAIHWHSRPRPTSF